jgi:predicted Fe-Mo cluster-binding NifX family protein
MVILAVPSNGEGGLNSNIHPLFGKCDTFTFITIEEGKIKKVKTVKNHALNTLGGAGVKAAQLIKNESAGILIAKKIGPNAMNLLDDSKIKLLRAPEKPNKIKELIDLFKLNELSELES